MCRGSFCSIHRTTEAWPPPEKVKSIGFQTKWRYIPFVFNNFHIHAFLGTKPTYDGKVLWMCGWMVSNGQIGHTYWPVKGPHWEHIYISTSARLRFSIHGEKVIFFCMAEVENASAGLADWTSFSKFVFRLHVGVWSEGPSVIVDHKEPPMFITQLPFAMFTSGAQVQQGNPEKSRESWKRSRKRFFF